LARTDIYIYSQCTNVAMDTNGVVYYDYKYADINI
jgi:hypothetical protein